MTRARMIVKLAATKPSSVATMLSRDERGAFEKLAGEYLDKTADQAKRMGLSPGEVDKIIADRLVIDAIDALILSKKGE